MRVRWVVLLIVFGLLLPKGAAQAQDDGLVRLSALEITLWPEYDEPELLVIFQGRLADDVPLPAALTLTIPKEASRLHAVASVNEAGERLNAAHDVQAAGDGIKVTFTSLEHRAFQLEYYWDILQVEGKRRWFEFFYQLDVPVDDFALELQQPLGATSLVMEPPAAESYPGFADLTYHLLSFGAMDAGQVVSWQVSYEKPDSSSGSGLGTGAIIAIGVALVVVIGGFWIAGSRRQAGRRRPSPQPRAARPPKSSRRRRGKDRKGTQPRRAPSSPTRTRSSRRSRPAQLARPAEPQTSPLPAGGFFCHQCGTAQKPEAIFCHNCGARRKGA
jgi:hypothetical protein